MLGAKPATSIQVQRTWWYASPAGGETMKLPQTSSATSAERPTEPAPIQAAAVAA